MVKKVLMLVVLGLLALSATAQAETVRPFGPYEASIYRVALAQWSDPMPGCFYVEARVISDPPPNELGSYWRSFDTCHIHLAESALSDPVLVCLILTHETGHMLGHDHSTDPESVMFPSVSSDHVVVPACADAANLPPATLAAPAWQEAATALKAHAASLRKHRCATPRCRTRLQRQRHALADEWKLVTQEAERDPALV